MNIIAIGINHKIASVHIREVFNFDATKRHGFITGLQKTKHVKECVVLNTCNRFEVYAVVDSINLGKDEVRAYLTQWYGKQIAEYISLFYLKEEEEALHHLFKVTSGLDSLVLGETQILGQVKDAFLECQSLGVTSTIFNRLFKQAISLAKLAHTQTGIGRNPVSVSYAAAELVKKGVNQFCSTTALIIGAGETGRLAAKHLTALCIQDLTVVNRTFVKAEFLARECNGRALPYSQLNEEIHHADVIISAIHTDKHILTKDLAERVIAKRKKRPLLIIDLSVPRSVEESVAGLEGIKLYDVDDLRDVIHSTLLERKKEAAKIEQMIGHEILEFKQWLDTLGVIPLITALTNRSSRIHKEAMTSIENKLPSLTERELMMIQKYSKMMINQLLRGPILSLKEMAAEGSHEEREQMFNTFARIFSLEDMREDQEKTILIEEKRNLIHSQLI